MAKTSTTWPKVVPILEPEEFHQGSATARYPSGRRNYNKQCILSWGWHVFPASQYEKASERFAKVLDDEFWKLKKKGFYCIAHWNDSPETTKDEIAALWKKVMRRLGYTVPCKRQ